MVNIILYNNNIYLRHSFAVVHIIVYDILEIVGSYIIITIIIKKLHVSGN